MWPQLPRLGRFEFLPVFVRLAITLFVVFSTYNPTGWSYLHWVESAWSRDWMLQLPLLPVYLFAYIWFLRATIRALRYTGIALTVSFLSAIAWVLNEAGLVPLRDAGDVGLVALYVFAGLLGIGVTWMQFWVILTGQVSVDNLTA